MKIFRVRNKIENPIFCPKCGENNFSIPSVENKPTIVQPNNSLQTICNNCKNEKVFRVTNDILLVKPF